MICYDNNKMIRTCYCRIFCLSLANYI